MRGFLLNGWSRWAVAMTVALSGSALGVALSACQPREPLRIGFVGGISGRWSDLGIGARNGALLAVEDLGAKGGLDGREIALLVYDDEQQPERAAQAVRDLAAQKVAFIVGPMTGLAADAMAPVLDKLELLAISPTSTSSEFGPGASSVVHVVCDIRVGARQQADELWRRGAQSVATVADLHNRSFAQAWVDAFARRFEERGGAVVTQSSFDSSGGPAYGRLARELLGARPDAVLLAASAVDTALISQQLRAINGPVLIASSPWAGTEPLIELGGAAVEGALVGQYFDRDSQTPQYLRFAKAYRERFGEAPGFTAVNAYDAVALGVTAWRERSPGQALGDALRSLHEVPGLQQLLHLDAHGNADTPMFITSVTGNRFGSASP